MFRKSMRRQTAGFILATLLAMSAPAAAASALGRHDGDSLWAGVWAWIAALWEKEGYTGTTTAGGERGSGIDPNGQPCATCSGTAGTPPVQGEEGPAIDPNGTP